MRRILHRFAIAASLMLCIACAALHVRTCWWSDAIVYYGPGGHVGVQSIGGSLVLGTDNVGQPHRHVVLDSWRFNVAKTTPAIGTRFWGRLGFGFDVSRVSTAKIQYSLPSPLPPEIVARRYSIPLWTVTLLSALLPLWAALRWIRARRRHGVGRCSICGYDLRASPERCPECGAVPAATLAAVANLPPSMR